MTRLLAAALVVVVVCVVRNDARAQVASPLSRHVVIPFLANASKPADLDFQGGECDVDSSDSSGNTMECTFQQVFLTTTGVAPDTCMITTSRYQRTFRRETSPGKASQPVTSRAPARWVSTESPEGDCGLVDVATLQYEGGVKWTMEMRKTATKRDAACRALEGGAEMLSWQNVRRPLPCRFVQPGGLSR